MNKTDYIEIGRVIRESELDEPSKVEALDKKKIVNKLVAYFKASNPRFIESRFRKDCTKFEEDSI